MVYHNYQYLMTNSFDNLHLLPECVLFRTGNSLAALIKTAFCPSSFSLDILSTSDFDK